MREDTHHNHDTAQSATEDAVLYLLALGASERAGIREGSAIVGWAHEEGAERVSVWYEGNLYGSSALRAFVERARTAHGRMVTNYPTVARSVLNREDLVAVGWYDPRMGRVNIDPEHHVAVAAWCGTTWREFENQLESEGVVYQTQRAGFGPEIRNWNQAIQHAVRHPGQPASQRLLAQIQQQRGQR